MPDQFKLEDSRPVASILMAIGIGTLALILIDYLFAGMAPVLGFIVAAVVIYIFFRR